MITSLRFSNPKTSRQYLLEYGTDLFGNRFVKIRYGIKLSIVKTYLFENTIEQFAKVDSIIYKRKHNGYITSK